MSSERKAHFSVGGAVQNFIHDLERHADIKSAETWKSIAYRSAGIMCACLGSKAIPILETVTEKACDFLRRNGELAMKKVAELDGADLDYWVARAEGLPLEQVEDYVQFWNWRILHTDDHRGFRYIGKSGDYAPHKNWAQGGPIIEREKINAQWFYKRHEHDHRYETWSAWSMDGTTEIEGPTLLIAAMRVFVASRFGAEVE